MAPISVSVTTLGRLWVWTRRTATTTRDDEDEVEDLGGWTVHDWDGYRRVVDYYLEALSAEIPEVDPTTPEAAHLLYSSAALRRSRELLVEAQRLLAASPVSEGALLLARGSFEATVLAMWLLPSLERYEELAGDYARNQAHLLKGPNAYLTEEFVDRYLATLPTPRRSRPIEQMLNQIADWLGKMERLPFGPPMQWSAEDGKLVVVGEPPKPDGEPFRSAYGVYRMMSTNSVHGLGSLRPFLKPRSDRHQRGFEHVAMMTDLLAKAVAYRNGHFGFSEIMQAKDPARLPYVGARSWLTTVVNAIGDNNASVWHERVEDVEQHHRRNT